MSDPATIYHSSTPALSEIKKINLGDTAGIKGMLDDTVASILDEEGYEQDFTLANWKIGISVVACIIAIISHYYPLPFPDNKLLLIACVLRYVI